MSQFQQISIADLKQIIAVAETNQRPIEIDWINRKIDVLSDFKQNQKTSWQEYLAVWQNGSLSGNEIKGKL